MLDVWAIFCSKKVSVDGNVGNMFADKNFDVNIDCVFCEGQCLLSHSACLILRGKRFHKTDDSMSIVFCETCHTSSWVPYRMCMEVVGMRL